MKNVNIYFTDEEHSYMTKIKDKISKRKKKLLTWHDFVLAGATEIDINGDEEWKMKTWGMMDEEIMFKLFRRSRKIQFTQLVTMCGLMGVLIGFGFWVIDKAAGYMTMGFSFWVLLIGAFLNSKEIKKQKEKEE